MQRVRKTQELIAWVNQKVDADLKTLDDARGGALICQIFHTLYPFDLSKVDFLSRNEYHYERNYKVLQQVFTEYKIEKDFNIQNMILGEKKRDLYYFLSWVRLHYDRFAEQIKNVSSTGYKAKEERNAAIAARRKRATKVHLLHQHQIAQLQLQGSDSSLPRGSATPTDCSSPRSSSTRSLYSQLSCFTSYTTRFHAKVRCAQTQGVGGGSSPFGVSTTQNNNRSTITAKGNSGAAVASHSPSTAPPVPQDGELTALALEANAEAIGRGEGNIEDRGLATCVETDIPTALRSSHEELHTGEGMTLCGTTSEMDDLWADVRRTLRLDPTIIVKVPGASDYDWWALGKVPGTVRHIPRTGSSPCVLDSSMGQLVMDPSAGVDESTA